MIKNQQSATNTNALNILTSHVVIASPMGAAISFFMELLRRYAPRKDKSFIAFVLDIELNLRIPYTLLS